MSDSHTSQRVVLRQVHPAKLAVDVSASMLSNWLLWRHRRAGGLFVRYGLPVAGSMLVLSVADVDRLAQTPAGRYVLRSMSHATTAIRLTGDTIMAAGAWRHRPDWLMGGLAIVALGWLWGPIARELRAEQSGW